MRLHRIHIDTPLATDTLIELPAERTNYLLRVLRLREGNEFTAFDGHGGEYRAVIEHAGKHKAMVRIAEHDDVERESPLDIHLYQAVSRGERMDYTIQKAVELGVSRILPVFSQRSVVQLKGERLQRKQAHWQQIAISACEQCGRNRIPPVEIPRPLGEALQTLPTDRTSLLLDPLARQGLADIDPDNLAISLLIGPEGGLTADEIGMAAGHGFVGVQLGPRILRTETAAVTAIAILQSHRGDL